MKNLFTIIAFAFVMLFGIQNTNAQSLSQKQDKAEVVAKTQVAELSKQLNLTGDQQRSLFRAFVQKEVNYRKYINGKDAKDAQVIASKAKFDKTFTTMLKKNLTAEQYKKWLSLQEK
ncbi:MAG: hypothetical protein ACWA45_04660 [Flavobacteriales bacterium]